MLKAVLRTFLKGEKGFTLIELLAVMGIVAVLAAIVSTSVAGTGEKSRDTTAQQDAQTTQTAASTYNVDQGASVLTTTTTALSITTVSTVAVNVSGEANVTSSAWPEDAIADTYTAEFQSGSEGTVNDVTLTLDDGTTTVNEATLMADYTAIDFATLIAGGYSDKAPASASMTRVIDMATDVSAHDYLWLFEKSTSSSGSTDDSRSVVVFKLDSVTVASDVADLSYKQIF